MYYKNIIISFFLILFIHLTYEQGSGSYEIRELSLSRPYSSVFATSTSNWHLTGNTLVTDRYIRLTSDTQSKSGGLWNTIPVIHPDWEMHVQFKVHGDSKNFYGDGFVIWYVKDPKLNGPIFGYQDYFNGLAIIMDTYANKVPAPHSFPYISAVINNGSLHYDHDNDGVNVTIAGCEAIFRGRNTDTSVAIRYENNRLTVSTDIDGTNSWRECFSIDNILLPTHYYFGFSAATGELSDNHDIISVRTYQLDSSEQRRTEDRKSIIPSAPSADMGTTDAVPTTSSTWSALKIFFLIVALIILCVGGIFTYYYYMKNRRRGPRFY